MSFSQLVSVAASLTNVIRDGKKAAATSVQLWNSAGIDAETLNVALEALNNAEGMKKQNDDLKAQIALLQDAIWKDSSASAAAAAVSLQCEEDMAGSGSESGSGSGSGSGIGRVSGRGGGMVVAVSFEGKGKRKADRCDTPHPNVCFTTPPRVVRTSSVADDRVARAMAKVKFVQRKLACGLNNTAPAVPTRLPLSYDGDCWECPECGGDVCMCDITKYPSSKRVKQEPQ